MSTLRVDNITDEAGVNPTNFPVGINAANLIGQVVFVGMTTPPAGYLKANGAAVSRSTYSDLFSAIGTTFGSGNGSTTFNLPDLRGEFPRGWDDGRGVDSGRSFGSAQLDQMQRLTGILGSGKLAFNQDTTIDGGAFTGLRTPSPADERESADTAEGNEFNSWEFDSENSPNARTSSTTSGETRSRNIALLACIKF